MTLLQIWMWLTRPFDWRKSQQGFTLVEIMVVGIILFGLALGIFLMAFLIPRCVWFDFK